VSRLPAEHRQLIQLRYFQEMEIPDIAQKIERTEGAVYRALSRVRMTLMECVQKQTEALT
jgi:RNA polymerase sigma-70 factor (ECF subfamily)